MKQSIKLLSYTAFISAGLFILSPETSSAETVVSVQQFSYDSNLRVSCTAQRMNPSVYGSLPNDACALGTEGSYGKDRISKNVYDAAGQLTQVFQAYGTTDQRTYATFSYSNNGKVIDTIDANGNRTHNVYDGFDRLVTVNYPSTTRAASYNGSTQANALATANAYSATDYETYGYDANDNKTTWRRRDGSVIYYSYDNLNRQTLMDLPGGTAGDVYTNYDAVGHVLSRRFVSTSGAGVSYAYDGLGRVSSTTDINGFTIGYQYNQAGARTALIYPDGNYIGYTLDAANRITATGWNSYSGLFSQSYDDLGRLTGIGKGGAGSTAYGYDGVGRLSSQTNDLPGSANDVTYSFTSYNPASQILGINTSSTVYDYVETTTSSTNRSFDGLNRNAGIAALSGGYDARGNLTYDGTRTFTYDILNRLYYKHSTDGAVDIALSYDPEGRLYAYNSGGAVTYFLYDGTDLIGEYSAGGALLRRYVHSSRDDDPQVWLEGSSNTNISYVYTNYQGSVIATTNAAGSNLQIYKYSPYGEPRDASNNAAWSGFRFRYTGQQILPEARLYHYKARAYDPVLGTFLQTDPIGSKDDLDLYAYVGDDPVNKSDPMGLAGCADMSKADCSVVMQAQKEARMAISKTQSDLKSLTNERSAIASGKQNELSANAKTTESNLNKWFGDSSASTINNLSSSLKKIDAVLADDGTKYNFQRQDIGNLYGRAMFGGNTIKLGTPFFNTENRNKVVTAIHEPGHIVGLNFLAPERYEGTSKGWPSAYRLYNADDVAIFTYDNTHR